MKVRLKYSAFWPCVYIIILAELLYTWHCWKPVLQRNSLHPIAIWAIYNRDIVNYWWNSDCSIIQLCMEWYSYMAVTKVMVSPPKPINVCQWYQWKCHPTNVLFIYKSVAPLDRMMNRACLLSWVSAWYDIQCQRWYCVLLLMHDDRSNVDNWHSKCTAG